MNLRKIGVNVLFWEIAIVISIGTVLAENSIKSQDLDKEIRLSADYSCLVTFEQANQALDKMPNMSAYMFAGTQFDAERILREVAKIYSDPRCKDIKYGIKPRLAMAWEMHLNNTRYGQSQRDSLAYTTCKTACSIGGSSYRCEASCDNQQEQNNIRRDKEYDRGLQEMNRILSY